MLILTWSGACRAAHAEVFSLKARNQPGLQRHLCMSLGLHSPMPILTLGVTAALKPTMGDHKTKHCF